MKEMKRDRNKEIVRKKDKMIEIVSKRETEKDRKSEREKKYSSRHNSLISSLIYN